MREKIDKKHRFIPKVNKFLVFDAIRRNGPLSNPEIVRATNLSKPTVTRILRELREEGYIREMGVGESGGGRPPVLYGFDPHSRFVVGVDFEIPGVRIVVVNLEGRIVSRRSHLVDVKASSESIVEKLKAEVRSALRNSPKVASDKLIGVGVAISGFLDRGEGVSLCTPRIPQWRNVPLGRALREEFGTPVRLVNDVDAMAMAELKFGLNDRVDSMIYIGFTEGLGSGLLLNGDMISGVFGNAGLIGHMTVDPDGPLCICGNRGCLETYASERGLVERVRERARINPLDAESLKRYEGASVRDVFAMSKSGDPICREAISEMTRYLAIGIANLVNLLEVNLVIIGGSVVELGEEFLERLNRDTKSHLQDILRADLRIEFARLKGEDVGAWGATIPFLEDFFGIPELRIDWEEAKATNPPVVVMS
ncbi:MAG: ROK family transcriptional regulator [bacterium]